MRANDAEIRRDEARDAEKGSLRVTTENMADARSGPAAAPP